MSFHVLFVTHFLPLWFLVFSLAIERRIPGFFFWLGKGRFKMGSQAMQTRQAAQSRG